MTALDGARFALDAPTSIAAIWGDGSRVLWAQGEPLMLAGPDGVGKTTLGQQLVLRRAGIRTGHLLGHSVAPDEERRTLYLALDRPRQAARSMRRMIGEEDRDALRERLVVWAGELPFDLIAEPAQLAQFAHDHNAGTVVLDSVKDVGPKLGEEEGHAINRAMQLCVADGIEVLALHHQRKAQAENKRPRSLSDVYGSRWLTAGCGSVLMLWGEAGDPIVECVHLKQPAETVGPLTLEHEATTGSTIVADSLDAASLLAASPTALTAKDIAAALFKKQDPDRNSIAKAKRRLATAVAEGRAEQLDTSPGEPALWAATKGGARGGCTEGCTPSQEGVHGEGARSALHSRGAGTPAHVQGAQGAHNGRVLTPDYAEQLIEGANTR
jgi:replicative DNA helicase